MDSVTQPVGRASVPRTLDEVRRYLIARDRGIDSARPAAFAVEQADVAGFRLVTFHWEWPGPTRPDAPRPDGFVMWTELSSTLAVGFPRTTGVQLPLAARSFQILLPPGMVLRAGIQTFRTVHRTVEYGELVQPEDWLVSALDMAPAGTTLDWGSITGTLSDQTDLQAALAGKLDDAQLSDEEYNAATWDGVATVAPSKNAVRDALQGMLGYINTYTWQPGDEITVPDEAYGSGWNGSTEVPTKNAVYDKIESISTTPAPTNAPSSLAVGSTQAISAVAIAGGTLEVQTNAVLVEYTWNYTQGAVPADGFELRVISGDFTATFVCGVGDTSYFVPVPKSDSVTVNVRAYRTGPSGRVFSMSTALLHSISGDIAEADLQDATKLQSRAVAADAPAPGDVLTWDSGESLWVPAPVAAGGFAWNEVTGTSQTAAANNGYIANNASLVTVTLPATAAVGDIVRVVGKGAGKWRLKANTGQTIRTPYKQTSVGGQVDGREQFAAVEVVCVSSDTSWVVLSDSGVLDVS